MRTVRPAVLIGRNLSLTWKVSTFMVTIFRVYFSVKLCL